MEYRELPEASREHLERHLADREDAKAVQALLALALSDPDGAWVQRRALPLTEHPARSVRAAAALALGHTARLHPELSSAATVTALQALEKRDPELAGRVEDALDDVRTFSHDQRGSEVTSDPSTP
jgi:hypothetical protein